MADGTAELGCLPAGCVTRHALAHYELIKHGINPAHVAVALEPHHIAGAELPVHVQIGVLHEMPDGQHAMLPAPRGDAAIHRAAPGLGQGIQILVARRHLFFAGQFGLVSDIRLLPVHVPLGEHAVEFGAPIARRLRLVIEEAADGLAKIGPVMLEVRLIDRLQEPVHAILARAVHAQLRAALLEEPRRLLVRELEDAPLAVRGLPANLAALNVECQVNQRVAFHLAIGIYPPGDSSDVTLSAIALGFKRAGTFHFNGRCFQPFGCVARGHFSGYRLARPPFLVEDPQLQILLLCGRQADVEVAPPAWAHPIRVRAGFRCEGAVAALGHLAHVHLQSFLAVVAVQPEQRAGEAAGVWGQFAELLFEGSDARTAGAVIGISRPGGVHCAE